MPSTVAITGQWNAGPRGLVGRRSDRFLLVEFSYCSAGQARFFHIVLVKHSLAQGVGLQKLQPKQRNCDNRIMSIDILKYVTFPRSNID